MAARALVATENSCNGAGLRAITLRGARLHVLTEQQCAEWVFDSLDSLRGGSINTMNLDHLRRFVRDQKFAALYNRATIHTADGMPLIWASKVLGTPLPERVTGSNLIWALTSGAVRKKSSVFLLGGAPGMAQRAAAVLSHRYPELRIAGVSSEPDRENADRGSWERIGRIVAAAKPDIVLVALACPIQEELIDALRDTLPQSWWVGVGIAFSFVAGAVPRAPLWMQRAGLEWLHRLSHEPRRLARRYLVDGLPFAIALLAGAGLQRLSMQRDASKP
jgi:N-acetylglucosaminyldiphosphoundecaprenol N-acetyl-beta-D-mannosaminyltransferase